MSGEECDPSSGQCSCLPGVGEMLCDSCVAGFWNLSAGVGCEPCDCAEGSSSGECDQLSGQCSCNEGITGDDCSRCLDGFFNFSPTGCTREWWRRMCECPYLRMIPLPQLVGVASVPLLLAVLRGRGSVPASRGWRGTSVMPALRSTSTSQRWAVSRVASVSRC